MSASTEINGLKPKRRFVAAIGAARLLRSYLRSDVHTALRLANDRADPAPADRRDKRKQEGRD
jgi:hypothetical protein